MGMDKPDWRILLLVAVVAAASGGIAPTLSPSSYRPDPFTGEDGHKLTEDLKEHIRNELTLFELRHSIFHPPKPVRRRLEALEEAMRELKPGWRPPTKEYGSFTGPELTYPST